MILSIICWLSKEGKHVEKGGQMTKRRLKAGKLGSGGLGLTPLTEAEMNELHLASMEVMRTKGIFVESKEARELYGDNGCIVDEKNRLVKIPEYLVMEAVNSAPTNFKACGRLSEYDIMLEDTRVSFTNFGEGIEFVNPYTLERKASVKEDTCMTAKIVDYLDHVETYERSLLSHDKAPPVQALHNAHASLTNTCKHHWLGPVNTYQLNKIHEMCSIIVGGDDILKERPLLTYVTAPISPLRFSKDQCDILMEGAKLDHGVNVIGMAMPGASAPVHMASSLVIYTVEQLGSLVLNQLSKKGSYFVSGASMCMLDMRYGTASVGCPEAGILNCAVGQIARRYGLPSFAAGG